MKEGEKKGRASGRREEMGKGSCGKGGTESRKEGGADGRGK